MVSHPPKRVEPKRKFINVAVQVLRAGVMIDANQTALQDGKHAFDAVGRRLSIAATHVAQTYATRLAPRERAAQRLGGLSVRIAKDFTSWTATRQ